MTKTTENEIELFAIELLETLVFKYSYNSLKAKIDPEKGILFSRYK